MIRLANVWQWLLNIYRGNRLLLPTRYFLTKFDALAVRGRVVVPYDAWGEWRGPCSTVLIAPEVGSAFFIWPASGQFLKPQVTLKAIYTLQYMYLDKCISPFYMRCPYAPATLNTAEGYKG